MSDLRWELNRDGSLIEDEPQTAKKFKELIIQMFSQFGWICRLIENTGTFYRINIRNFSLNKNLDINIYAGKIQKESYSKNHFEKKIQLGSLDPRTRKDELTLILGIYVKKQNDLLSEAIIVAWPIDEAIDYTTNPNLYVDTKNNMQKAKTYGFCIDETKDKNLVAFRPEFIFYYLYNYRKFHKYKYLGMDIDLNIYNEEKYKTIDYPYNRIIFGAPGTGKSYRIESQRSEFENNYERVTFHPSYSYAQFVGIYKPKPKFKTYGTEYISYEFVAGPFLRIWIKAMKNKEQNFLLVIEEINRANVSSVFGDIFQLLDRNSQGSSQYNITTSEEMRDYLVNEGFIRNEVETIAIPNNMYIWATMNSSDQCVYPMDAAFKRRWRFEYIGINEGRIKILNKKIRLKPYGLIEWDKVRTMINDRLTEEDLNITEDKLIGPFFLSDEELTSFDIDEIFKSKLLMYLFEDVLRHRKGKLFKSGFNTFSQIIEAYDRMENIFEFELNNQKNV